jgi:hypothetical protein
MPFTNLEGHGGVPADIQDNPKSRRFRAGAISACLPHLAHRDLDAEIVPGKNA